MSEILKEINRLKKKINKEVKNILTDETSREYVQALIDNVKLNNINEEVFQKNIWNIGLVTIVVNILTKLIMII